MDSGPAERVRTTANADLPKYDDLLWPTLEVLKRIGGSGTISEIVEETASYLSLPESVQSIPHGATNRTELEYRSAWARTHLKYVGAVDNSERGVWVLTARGRSFASESEVREAVRAWRAEYREKRQKNREQAAAAASDDLLENELEPEGWREGSLAVLKTMPADGFERLSQRVLRESGFVEVEVTGRSGGGGIDGGGILKLDLLSFHVVFQSKRYRETVSANVIRDFRGGMVGRADKGLVITTGRFTPDAKREAVRDGAPAIDLVDGEAPCDLLKRLSIGVRTEMVEEITFDRDWFMGLQGGALSRSSWSADRRPRRSRRPGW